MGSLSLSVHPLFFLFGFYYAFTGRIFIFAIYTLSALIHELAHSYVAQSFGYKLNNITLMPFGAVVSGNINDLALKDQIKIALAGPLTNLAVGLFFVAGWWIFPQSYAFTDVIVWANLSMALLNFAPAYPLDGGRVISAILSLRFGEKKAYCICKVMGGVLGALLVALFVYSCFVQINLSILFFALFVIFGALSQKKQGGYVKIFTSGASEKLRRGAPVKRLAVDKNVQIKKLINMLDAESFNEVVVFDKDRHITTLREQKIGEIVQNGSVYDSIAKYL